MKAKAIEVAEKFWELMKTNDFRSVGSVLADDFVLDWPQSNERIRGRDNFAAMNEENPASGRWEMEVYLPEFPPRQNQLQIDFVGFSFAPGESLRYQGDG